MYYKLWFLSWSLYIAGICAQKCYSQFRYVCLEFYGKNTFEQVINHDISREF